MFPLVVDLRDRRVVVIGAGRVSAQKVSQLLAAGARITIITEEVLVPVSSEIESLVLRPYEHGDLDGAFLAVSATGNKEVDDCVVAEADERNILLNVVDDAARSNFFFTAVHRDGDVVVSVSTEGASPALATVAKQLRGERHALHSSGQSTENLAWMARVEELINKEDVAAPPVVK